MNHVKHGWALLAMRLPQIRPLTCKTPRVANMCEHYSIAVLYLEELKKTQGSTAEMAEYEGMIAGIEIEAFYYMNEFAKHSA